MKKEKRLSQIWSKPSMLKQRKGVSPVIATVLLITMVVVIALIIFLWFRNINKEAITKFDGTNVEIICNDVNFKSSYSLGNLYVLNSGNVPLYSIKMRISNSGSYSTIDLQDVPDSNWPEKGLNSGAAFSSTTLSNLIYGSDEVLLIPVLIGISEDTGEEKLHTCDENFGKELDII